jgi:hypothetical protein
MSKNKLYNAINELFFVQRMSLPPSLATLSFKTFASGNKYFLLELPIEHSLTIGPYTLTEHHLTVHELPSAKLDLKSQYHYTACFNDTTDNKYRLHLYFNAKDEYICEPLFSRITPENEFIPVDCLENHPAFKALACASIPDLVTHLRNQQNSLLNSLQIQSNELQESMEELSRDLTKNSPAYLLKTKSLIKIVEKQIEYLHQNEEALGLLQHLKRLEKAIEQSRSATPKRVALSSPKKEETKVHLRSHAPKRPKIAPTPLTTSKINLTALNAELENVKIKKGDACIDSLVALINTVNDKELELELGISVASPEELHNLHQLKIKLNQLGKRKLEFSIALGLCDRAQKLAPFYHLITIDPLVLEEENSKLIEFLLENKLLSTQYKNFTVKEKTYNSLLDYYFNRKSIEKSTLECLDVCVKRGLSLMEIDRNTQLPFAALVLLEVNHPLKKILTDNSKLTILSPMFCKQLKQTLIVLSSQTTCPETRQKKIGALIGTIDANINLLRSNFLSTTLEKATQEVSERAISCFGSEEMQRLFDDPEVINLKTKIGNSMAILLPKLSHQEQIKIKKEAVDFYKKLKTGADALNNLGKLTTYEEHKKSTIEYLLKQLNAIDLREELVDIQKELRGKISYKGKINRRQKQLERREKEIVNELNKHQHSMISSVDKLVDVKQTKTGHQSLICQLKKLTD